MNGDELTNIEVQRFADFHVRSHGVAAFAISPLRVPFGIVQKSGSDITGFLEKPVLQSVLVSTGTYIFSRSILEFLPSRGNVEKETFPRLASGGLLKAHEHTGFWSTVNTMKELEEVGKQLRDGAAGYFTT